MAEKSEKSRSRGKAAASAVATITAAGVLVGGAVASPDQGPDDGPGPLVQTLDLGVQAGDDGGGAGEDENLEPEEEKRSYYKGVRRFMRSAPQRLRAAAFVPLWALGVLAFTLLSGLWGAVLSPLAATALGWLLIAVLAVLIYTLTAKTVFPKLPLKKILNRHSLFSILLFCLGFGLLDGMLPIFWQEYALASRLLKLFGSLIAAGAPLVFFLSRQKRRQLAEVEGEPVEPAPPELSYEQREAEARKLVEELADSVCPKIR